MKQITKTKDLPVGFYYVEDILGEGDFLLCDDNMNWEVLLSDTWTKIQFLPKKPNGEMMTLKEFFSLQIENGTKIFHLGL